MTIRRSTRLNKSPARLRGSISFALVKGYAAWGVKYCWGNPVNYDAGLHRTQADAKAAVQGDRFLGWGIAWTIREEPVCLVRDSRMEFGFSLSADDRLPELREDDTVQTLSDRTKDPSHTSIEPIRPDGTWNVCKGPWLWWRSSSFGGGSPLYWEESVQQGDPARAARKWIAKVRARRARTRARSGSRGTAPSRSRARR